MTGQCETCGVTERVQRVWVGHDDTEDEQNRCQHCAGDRWRGEAMTPQLAAWLVSIEAFLDEQADCDYGEPVDGIAPVLGNRASDLLAELRTIRGDWP